MAIPATERGPAFFCLEEHVERFFYSAATIGMEIPWSRAQIIAALEQTARRNRVRNGMAKFYAYYPGCGMGTLPADKTATVAIFCLDYDHLGDDRSGAFQPVSAGLAAYRKLHPETAAVHAKVTGNYVNGFLAATDARARGFDEALLLDLAGHVAEAPTANIFFVSGRRVLTPSTTNVLPGITRAVLMEIMAGLDCPVTEKVILPAEIESFDEAFFSSTLNPVRPIGRIEEHTFEAPGPVTTRIHERISAVLLGAIPAGDKWLSSIAAG